jgi:poly-gamma-glutamate synthesis protein (capsule biosynthesis protein)
VVQPVELLTSTDGAHQTVCAYSLGNFLSNQRADNIALTTGHSEDGLMFSFTLSKYSDGKTYVESIQLIPTWVLIRESKNTKTYHILPLDETVANWKERYELSSSQVNHANDSLERTNALVRTGLKEIQDLLTQQHEARGQIEEIFTEGVG